MTPRRIGVVYNEPIPSGLAFSEASRDVLDQVEAIVSSLEQLGHRAVRLIFTRNLEDSVRRIEKEKIEFAFNLCESVDEDPRFVGHPAAVLELLGIPFSGSPSFTLMLTTDKLMTKRLLKANGIRTPSYQVYDGFSPLDTEALNFPVIIKPRFEDASIGIDQDSICSDDRELKKRLSDFFSRFGPLLVEAYVEGREFNVSLWGYPAANVLPIAEIVFERFPEGMYPIVGYQAKWNKSSFAYNHTHRRFPTNIPDTLLGRIKTTALKCYRLMAIRDYGRVDIRVDRLSRIHVLEVNANPCLSPDAGFVAAFQNAGMSYLAMTEALVSLMDQRAKSRDHQAVGFSGQI
jgi:D-alanine-D-alanine ligase